jgi:hypothetical protein
VVESLIRLPRAGYARTVSGKPTVAKEHPLKLENPHNVSAIKPINETDVEVRYSDRKPSVILKNTTVSDVMSQITKAKAAKSHSDSA